jgi:hypothetical protein
MRTVALGIALLTAGQAWGQQTVTGTVANVEGEPVANAVVTLVAVSPGVAPDSYLSARSGVDGAFTIGNVPKGDYRACVRSATSPILDPCIWGGFPVTISVLGSAAPRPARVVATQGVELGVRVEDPEGRLAAFDEKASRRPPLIVGVFTPRKMYIPMALAAAGATVRQYRVIVPAGVALRLAMTSADFEFETDSEGGAGLLRRDGGSLTGSLTLPRGTAKTELRVRVRSKKQG